MWGRSIALGAFALFAVACAESATPVGGEKIASVATCSDSHDDAQKQCEDGRPLCDYDRERACAMCLCTAYPAIATTVVDNQHTGTMLLPFGPPTTPTPLR